MKHKDHEHSKHPTAQEIREEDIAAETAGTDASKNETREGETDNEKKIRELTEQCTALNDKYLRLMAEFDNYKRRSAKEYERLIESASERLMKDIVEVRDNFERGFKSNDTGEKFAEGMKMIFAKLNTILHKHGLEVYGEAGQEFNPELHDALMRTPHTDVAEGHIVEVHERGYKLNGKIIKHARVVVSSGKPETENNNNN
jgi:molecular chaperone GrpE